MKSQIINEPSEVEIDTTTSLIALDMESIVKWRGVPRNEKGITTLKQISDYINGVAIEVGSKTPVIDVLFELGINGYIYRYGSNGPFWELVDGNGDITIKVDK